MVLGLWVPMSDVSDVLEITTRDLVYIRPPPMADQRERGRVRGQQRQYAYPDREDK